MATKGIIERELKREKLVDKFATTRGELKERLRKLYAMLQEDEGDIDAIIDEIEALQLKLDRMPRNAKSIRKRRRCRVTGRPRGNFRRVGMCRNMFRLYAMQGLIPGLRKSSW